MEIVLIRVDRRPWGIDGHLYINRKRICDTVEHPVCCKPSGTYKVEMSNQPFRHGDGALASRGGEIIVGEYMLPGVVGKSQITYDRLYGRLKKACQRGRPISLTIRG